MFNRFITGVPVRTLAFFALMAAAPMAVHAQFDFQVSKKKFQVHSFASQGFMYSNQNNYMSMPTAKGSFAMTDGGANISSQLTDKLRVGAQVYVRNVGEFGNGRPELDWGFGDYKFKRWFGVRGGKVKTALGLYNDVQDMDSLHTFALLPQSIYPMDWRSTTIAHMGGDVYGDIEVKNLGTFSYTGYVGKQPNDLRSGYDWAVVTQNLKYTYRAGPQGGGDLRWTTPFGAVFGASYMWTDVTGEGNVTSATGALTPYRQTTTANNITQYYGQYTLKGFKIDVEYRRNLRDVNLFRTATPVKSIVDSRGWYVAGSYRIHRRLEVGAYRSQYYVDFRKDSTPPAQHSFDTTVAARVDLTGHWYTKIEGHFIDGAPVSPSAARGFYGASNPAGILPTTNVLVIRTGVSF